MAGAAATLERCPSPIPSWRPSSTASWRPGASPRPRRPPTSSPRPSTSTRSSHGYAGGSRASHRRGSPTRSGSAARRCMSRRVSMSHGCRARNWPARRDAAPGERPGARSVHRGGRRRRAPDRAGAGGRGHRHRHRRTGGRLPGATACPRWWPTSPHRFAGSRCSTSSRRWHRTSRPANSGCFRPTCNVTNRDSPSTAGPMAFDSSARDRGGRSSSPPRRLAADRGRCRSGPIARPHVRGQPLRPGHAMVGRRR